jgi:hypothetical protein
MNEVMRLVLGGFIATGVNLFGKIRLKIRFVENKLKSTLQKFH